MTAPIRVATKPIAGQRPGTSGLRAKTRVFREPPSSRTSWKPIWTGFGGISGKVLVLGGDGRFYGDQAAQVILRMAAASGAARVIVGRNGLLSTPAASNLIRKRGADGGIILSASHNPGGEEGDFGVKVNMANGGPAPAGVTGRIFDATQGIDCYLTLDTPDLDLADLGEQRLGATVIEVVDSVSDYAELMNDLFDFKAIKDLLQSGFQIRFDAMHAVTGPYAVEILERQLGAADGSILNATPRPDFGGGHPDPNPTWAKGVFDAVFNADGPDFAAASDGDGDRNMILGRGIYVTPSDSLAVSWPRTRIWYRGTESGLKGIARSMPTSTAVDRVAAARGLPCYATPTGWKFFGNLLDAGRITLCGEESFGTGSDHVREKDGLWAVLMWLNILAVTRKSVAQTLQDHWAEFGRTYYSRHDYERLDTATAEELIHEMQARLPDLPGTFAGPLRIDEAVDFAYTDPIDASVATHQGIEIKFAGGARAVLRLSGTGTEGATLRIYLEQHSEDRLSSDPHEVLAPVMAAVESLTDLAARTGRTTPDVVT
jgi:phosphoglucomutase